MIGNSQKCKDLKWLQEIQPVKLRVKGKNSTKLNPSINTAHSISRHVKAL
jgi:hypothetical protein